MRDCDFIPPDYHQTQTLRQAVKLRAAFVGVMFLLMGVWIVVHEHRQSAAEAMLGEIALQEEQLRIHRAKKQIMQQEQTRLHERQELVSRLSDQASLVVICSALSRCQPDTVVLTMLSLDSPSLRGFLPQKQSPARIAAAPSPASPPSPAENKETPSHAPKLGLAGIAATHPEMIQFAAALEKNPLFDRVYMEVKDPASWGGRRVEQFELVCELAVHEDRR